ncbi:hypothetical protein H7J77_04635 [Mycolicibacillus parakoreensis]|uniref:hypothetical protein n=1 Tax=Mycolicibacillus parakoreensis TaxID=1069221 RepID=UPI0021F2A1B6|nr:hypothetical protein [Mycolicibacillus parakoreensis]MCV7314823.1 hypothetical protein [Mycolicibacillus parakoreensis]
MKALFVNDEYQRSGWRARSIDREQPLIMVGHSRFLLLGYGVVDVFAELARFRGELRPWWRTRG